mgnify:CR=1 FL=1
MENIPPEINEIQPSPEELARQHSKEIAEFFGIENYPEIRAVFFDSKEELASKYVEYMRERRLSQGKPWEDDAPEYMVGWNPPGANWNEAWVIKVGALDNNNLPVDQERFSRILKHELTHAYIAEYTGVRDTAFSSPPSWLAEGVCYHLAGQKAPEYEDIISLELLKELSNTNDSRKYSVGQFMVEAILRDYGKKKLLDSLKITNDHENLAKELKEMFPWLK